MITLAILAAWAHGIVVGLWLAVLKLDMERQRLKRQGRAVAP